MVKDEKTIESDEWIVQGFPVKEFKQLYFKSIKKGNLELRIESFYVKINDGYEE